MWPLRAASTPRPFWVPPRGRTPSRMSLVSRPADQIQGVRRRDLMAAMMKKATPAASSPTLVSQTTAEAAMSRAAGRTVTVRRQPSSAMPRAARAACVRASPSQARLVRGLACATKGALAGSAERGLRSAWGREHGGCAVAMGAGSRQLHASSAATRGRATNASRAARSAARTAGKSAAVRPPVSGASSPTVRWDAAAGAVCCVNQKHGAAAVMRYRLVPRRANGDRKNLATSGSAASSTTAPSASQTRASARTTSCASAALKAPGKRLWSAHSAATTAPAMSVQRALDAAQKMASRSAARSIAGRRSSGAPTAVTVSAVPSVSRARSSAPHAPISASVRAEAGQSRSSVGPTRTATRSP